MFEQVCMEIRNAVYGIMCTSQVGLSQLAYSLGTAFMISPGIIVSAAHSVHQRSDPSQPHHTKFEVIRTPDIGQAMENAELIGEDSKRDLALLRISNPRSDSCVNLEQDKAPIGASCGSLGFPLAQVSVIQGKGRRVFIERFQGAHISSFHVERDQANRELAFYETDALMYGGSSGCPGFLENGKVFGMHNRSRIDKPKDPKGGVPSDQKGVETRLAISLWVPSTDIIAFARRCGVTI